MEACVWEESSNCFIFSLLQIAASARVFLGFLLCGMPCVRYKRVWKCCLIRWLNMLHAGCSCGGHSILQTPQAQGNTYTLIWFPSTPTYRHRWAIEGILADHQGTQDMFQYWYAQEDTKICAAGSLHPLELVYRCLLLWQKKKAFLLLALCNVPLALWCHFKSVGSTGLSLVGKKYHSTSDETNFYPNRRRLQCFGKIWSDWNRFRKLPVVEH